MRKYRQKYGGVSMKKILSILLACALILSCACAFAETAG